jgi:hypothetical protein
MFVLAGALGLFGVALNLLGLSLLLTSRRLRSVFNSMLSALLLLHTAYILVSTTLVLRMWTESYFLDLLFTHFLYPLKPMLMHAATFLTVLMARERSVHNSIQDKAYSESCIAAYFSGAIYYTKARINHCFE